MLVQQLVARSPTPCEAMAKKELRRRVQTALAKLKADDREAILMRHFEGHSIKEIAQILDIPEGTVASRLYHARRALKDALVEMGAEYP